MTTIDHRILIPASPQVVWDYISNLSRNPKWQMDCRSVTFLTQKRDGPGTRWRMVSEGGREFVLEITAWYKGLGYEYEYVDGANFQENKGRVRLQEIPEGTIVQWTFTYELPGLLSGLRDSLGMRRQVDKVIADSLRKLYLQIKAAGSGSLVEPKSLMRDAPDVEARSNYQPRHPTALADKSSETPEAETALPPRPSFMDEPPISEEDAQTLQPMMAIVMPPEPPVEDDDTRPNPLGLREAEPESVVDELPSGDEPDFLDTLAPYIAPASESAAPTAAPSGSYDFDFNDEPAIDPIFDTQPRRATLPLQDVRTTDEITAVKQEAPITSSPLPDLTPPTEPPVQTATEEAPPASEIETAASIVEIPAPASDDSISPTPEVTLPATPLTPTPIPPAQSEPQTEAALTVAVPEPKLEPSPVSRAWEEPVISQPSSVDTARVSIWEVFGVQRPSETQQMKAVVAQMPEPKAKSNRPDMTPLRIGLRTAFRRSRKTIRRIRT